MPNSDNKLVELSKPIYENMVLNECRSSVDSEHIRIFFQRLENAAENYVADLLLGEVRPEPSEAYKVAEQVQNVSLKVYQHLHDLDDRSRRVIEENFANIEPLLTYLDGLILACDLVSQVKLSKELQARFNLCLAVVNAMNSLSLKPSSRKGGLTESLVKYLANEIVFKLCKHQVNPKYSDTSENNEEKHAIEKEDRELKERELKIQNERFKLERRKREMENKKSKVSVNQIYIKDVNDSLSATVLEFKRVSKPG